MPRQRIDEAALSDVHRPRDDDPPRLRQTQPDPRRPPEPVGTLGCGHAIPLGHEGRDACQFAVELTSQLAAENPCRAGSVDVGEERDRLRGHRRGPASVPRRGRAALRAEMNEIVEDGVGGDARFWKLAQSLSALYPAGSEEKRWVDGVLARKKSFGF